MSELGQTLWSPPEPRDESTQIGRFLRWLRDQRGRSFDGYADLWQWSVSDLEGFWGSLWDFFGVRASTPYDRVLASREMPGAEWFTGARLNYAEHMLGTEEDLDRVAVVAHSQTRAPLELTFAELREQVRGARAGLQRLGVGPGDRVVGYLPNIPETLIASSPPPASARSGRRARRSSARAASSTASRCSSRRSCSRSPATATGTG